MSPHPEANIKTTPTNKALKQGSGTRLTPRPANLLRVSRYIACASPLVLAFVLSSCTSTGGSVEMAAASLQAAAPSPQLNSPPSFAPATTAQAPNAVATQPSLPAPAVAQAAGQAPASQIQTPASQIQMPASQIQAPPGQIVVGGPPLPGTQVVAASNSLAAPTVIETTSGASIPVPTLRQDTETQPQLAAIAPVIVSSPATNAAVLAPPKAKEAAKEGLILAPAAPAVTPSDPTAPAPKVAEITAEPGVQNLTAAPEFAAPAPKPRKKTLFESMFGGTATPAADQQSPPALPADGQLALATPTNKKALKPVALSGGGGTSNNIELASLDKPLAASQADGGDGNASNGDLPGVRKGALFEIKRRDASGNDLDVDISETDTGPVQLASAAGLARLAPNGLRVQRDSVDVACLKPQLVKMLKSIETHYGQSLVITSGYRSPGHNRQVRGAKNSLHMFCAAADFQVPGVSKWDLAKYLRSMPNRGGVGTYCNTESVHIDVGPDRDWNWRCSRRK